VGSPLVRYLASPYDRSVPLPPGNGATAGTFLVGGIWQGTWQIRHQTLRIEPFSNLARADREALLAEAAPLCASSPRIRRTTYPQRV
jgi:hypothetical protein